MAADTITIVIALIGGGGLVGGIVALLRLKPDVARVTVSAAEGAVIVQSGVIKSLQDEIARLCLAEEECERRCTEMEEKQKIEIEKLQIALKAIEDRQRARRGEDIELRSGERRIPKPEDEH